MAHGVDVDSSFDRWLKICFRVHQIPTKTRQSKRTHMYIVGQSTQSAAAWVDVEQRWSPNHEVVADMLRRHDDAAALADGNPDNGRQPSVVVDVAPDENVISVVSDAVEARHTTDVEDAAVD